MTLFLTGLKKMRGPYTVQQFAPNIINKQRLPESRHDL